MKTRIIAILVLSTVSLTMPFNVPAETLPGSQKQKGKKATVSQLAGSWKQVDSLANLNQPQSALAAVSKIYAHAVKEKNDPQVIKAIIYRIRLNSEFQENFLTKTIVSLQKEISIAGKPSRQILQSILAEIYWKNNQNNQYRFHDRTQVKPGLPDSIETWDLKTISGAITRTYLLSLENPDSLKGIPIGNFDAIVDCEPFDTKHKTEQTASAAKFYPTLYDFLAGRALDYFTTDNATPVRSTNPGILARPLLLSAIKC